MRNWAGNLLYSAAAIHYPRSIEEVCALVRQQDNVKILGTRHSFNAIADCTGGDLISLKRLDRIVRYAGLDTPEPTATIEGGMSYGQLCPQLDRDGLALHNLASLPHISVAGAVATATHGSGDGNGNLATAVVGMKIVDAQGEVKEISPASEGENFYAMVVGLGALGAVVELTLKIEPRYDMRQEVFLNLPMAQLREDFDAITSAAYSVSLFTDWKAPKFTQVWLKQRVGADEPAGRREEFFGATRASSRMHPLAHLPAENCTEQLGVVGPWHERLPHFRIDFTPSNGVELQTEYFVRRDRAADAIESLYAIGDQIAPLLQVTEIRTIDRDELLMSPCRGQKSVAIHFTWEQKTAAVMALLPTIQSRLKEFDARPHWGKLFHAEGLDFAALYGARLERFRALVKQHDPAGKFSNAFLRQTVLREP